MPRTPGEHPSAQTLAGLVGNVTPPDERAALERHLAVCARCRGELETLRAMGLGATESGAALADTHTPVTPRPQPEAPLAPGETVGRYVITRQLGRGAMGQVYVAHDPRLDRQVAVKLLRPDVPAVESKPLRARLEREARALARLSHPNVVAVHDLGDHGESLFIAMDYVEGQTLSDWLRTPRDWREARRLFAAAGAGLAAAHRAGLVHRDFKPDNVLLGPDGVPRVSDFGVSRRVDGQKRDGDEHTITGAGSLIGTPAYMSPEQFDGKPADARSDQFSFCVALYEALTGSRPYTGDSLRGLRDAVHAGGARFPLDARVPRWLQALVLRGLSPSPDDRFPSMDALLAALKGPMRLSRALVALALLAPLAAVLAWREVDRRRNDPCFRVDERASAAWTPELRQRLQTSVLATKVPWAVEAAQQLTDVFDGFVVRWRDDYRAACAQLESAAGPARTRALAHQACLDARLETFGRYRAAFDHADGNMVRDGPGAVASGLAGTACNSVELALDVPDDPARRAVFERLRTRYQELATDLRLSKSKDLRAEVQSAREEADAAGLRGLGASFRLLEARARDRREGMDVVVQVLEDAAVRAEGARDDWVLFHARLDLVKLLAERVDVKRARALVPALRAVAERLGLDPDKSSEVLHAEAVVLSAEGRLREAAAKQRESAEARSLSDPLAFAGWDTLSFLQSRLGQEDEARASGEKAQALARASVGEKHPAFAQVLITEATRLFRDKRIEEARAVMARALAVLEQDPDTRDHALALYNYAVTLNQTGHRDEALPMLTRAIALAEKFGDVARLATMYAGYAETLQEAGRLDEALPASERAVALAEQASGRDSPRLAQPLAVHGALLEALKRYPEAEAVLVRALALLSLPGANPVLRDITRYDLARVRWRDPSRRAAAVDEVTAVRAAFVARGDRYADYVQECDVWLKAHPPR